MKKEKLTEQLNMHPLLYRAFLVVTGAYVLYNMGYFIGGFLYRILN